MEEQQGCRPWRRLTAWLTVVVLLEGFLVFQSWPRQATALHAKVRPSAGAGRDGAGRSSCFQCEADWPGNRSHEGHPEGAYCYAQGRPQGQKTHSGEKAEGGAVETIWTRDEGDLRAGTPEVQPGPHPHRRRARGGLAERPPGCGDGQAA